MTITKITGIEVTPSIPKNSVTCRGVIQDLLQDTTTEFIQDNLSATGFQVLQIARLHDKKKLPTLAVITFAGAIRPRSVTCDGVLYVTRPYYEHPIQCKNCYRYAHTSTNCRSAATCAYCSGPKHEDILCPKSTRQLQPRCSNCQGIHTATSPSCPARQLQTALINYKTKYKTSFATAKDHIHPRGLSYAEALKRLNATTHATNNSYLQSSTQTPRQTVPDRLMAPTTFPNNIPVHPIPPTHTRSYASVAAQNTTSPPPFQIDQNTMQSLLLMMKQICSTLMLPGSTQVLTGNHLLPTPSFPHRNGSHH